MPANENADNLNNKYAATAWGESPYKDLTLPSGQVCLAKKLGMEELISAGIADDTDLLSGLVETEHIERVQPKPKRGAPKKAAGKDSEVVVMTENSQQRIQEAAQKAATGKMDAKSMAKFSEVLDRVVILSVQLPEVVQAPKVRSERVPGLIYTDMIDFNDKMEIFNHALRGTVKMQNFRSGSEQVVEHMEHVKDVQLPTESTT